MAPWSRTERQKGEGLTDNLLLCWHPEHHCYRCCLTSFSHRWWVQKLFRMAWDCGAPALLDFPKGCNIQKLWMLWFLKLMNGWKIQSWKCLCLRIRKLGR